MKYIEGIPLWTAILLFTLGITYLGQEQAAVNAETKVDKYTADASTSPDDSSRIQREQMREDTDATTRGRLRQGEERNEEREHLVEAAVVYRALAKDPKNQIPNKLVGQAKCVAIFPSVVTAALVVGGIHGDGVASCRTASGWSMPSFVDVTGGSLGAQIGGKATDIVLFVLDEEGKDLLKRGKFRMGTDVSVVAGSFDKSLDIQPKGIVAYARTEGVFAGASLVGVNVAHDTEALRDYYGQTVDYAALLDGEKSIGEKTPEINSLLEALSNT